ncbi:MAG: hypothetical protein AAGM21_14490 [Pseudomonadota bacterium]
MDEIKGHIRTWAEIDGMGGEDALTPAELQLRDAVVAGEFCKLGENVPPELEPGQTPDPEVHIRAEVLRYFILGGCEKYKSDPTGVWIQGAHVTGTLNIGFHKVPGAIDMSHCRFDQRIDMEQARVEMLDLSNCHLAGLYAPHLNSKGAVFLSDVTSTAEVALNSAEIGGQLDCEGAKFLAETGNALNAQGVKTGADMFLRDVTAKATVNVNGAEIGGQLACNGAKFLTETGDALDAQGIKTGQDVFLGSVTAKATVDVNGADIGGQLSCNDAKFEAKEGFALTALGMKTGQGLFWRGVTAPHAMIDFTDAHATMLVDDTESWPGGGRIELDGFTYDRIIGGATDAKTRLDWIAKGEKPGRFFPQPYTHLAKVLREMGHEWDSRAVLIGRERRHNWHRRQRFRVALDGTVRAWLKSIWYDLRRFGAWTLDCAARLGAGYGYKPFRTLLVIAGLIGITWLFSAQAYNAGDFAPNSDIIQLSDDWVFLAATAPNPADAWSDETAAGRDWETFDPIIYAADVVIPIINFGQTEAWAPSTTRGPWGWHLWWFKSVMALAGWIVTAIGAAAITGIIRRD